MISTTLVHLSVVVEDQGAGAAASGGEGAQRNIARENSTGLFLHAFYYCEGHGDKINTD